MGKRLNRELEFKIPKDQVLVKQVIREYKMLKPCPFCGSRNVEECNAEYYRIVTCLDCSAIGPFRGSKSAAMMAWNRRAE